MKRHLNIIEPFKFILRSAMEAWNENGENDKRVERGKRGLCVGHEESERVTPAPTHPLINTHHSPTHLPTPTINTHTPAPFLHAAESGLRMRETECERRASATISAANSSFCAQVCSSCLTCDVRRRKKGKRKGWCVRMLLGLRGAC